LALLFAAATAAGPRSAQAGVWTSFTTDDGLTGNEISALASSDSGTIFIATNGIDPINTELKVPEIVEYDGIRFDTLSNRYSPAPDFRGLASGCPVPRNSTLSAVALAPNGDVWVGTQQNGVFRLGPDDFEHFTVCTGLGSNWVTSVVVEPDGSVWVATITDPRFDTDPTFGEGGLCRYDGASWTIQTIGGVTSLTAISDLARSQDGVLWMTHNEDGGGLTRFDGASFTNFQRPLPAFANRLSNLSMAVDDKVWVSSNLAGVGVFGPDGTWLADYTTSNGLVTNSRKDIASGKQGDVWVGSNFTGVEGFNGATWQHWDISNSGLIDNGAAVLEVDPAGVLWVGTSVGLSRYEGSQWLTLDENHGLPGLRINDLSRGPAQDLPPEPQAGVTRGPVYAAVRPTPGDPLSKGGLLRVSGLTAESITREDSSALEGVFKTVAAIPGGVWAAAEDTIYRAQGLRLVERFSLPAGVDPDETISTLLVGSGGRIWAGTENGPKQTAASVILRYDGASWSEFAVAGFTPSADAVRVHAEDAAGLLWASTFPNGGAGRIDPSDGSHQKFGIAEGLPSADVQDIIITSTGEVWFGTVSGVGRLRGSTVETVPSGGLPSLVILALGEDQRGRIWAATLAGVAYFDGDLWTAYNTVDGLPDSQVNAVLADTSEAVLGTFIGGLTLFRSDFVPPRATVTFGPPPVIGSRSFPFAFAGGDLDSRNELVELAWSLNGAPATPFSKDQTTQVFNLIDGPHTFEVWSRDRALNVSKPARHDFEVDATPPQPIIASPTFGRAVAGRVGIFGDVSDERFGGYVVEFSPAGEERNWQTIDTGDTIPAIDVPLATWDTEQVLDGDYVIRVAVNDTFNLTGFANVGVIVDNEEPGAEVTTPAKINNQTGGRVYTLNAEVEAYFPPQALDQDRVVTITAAPQLPTAPPGAGRWLGGWQFTPAEFDTRKPVTLTFSLAALDSVVQAAGGAPIQKPGALGSSGSTTTLGIFAVGADSTYSFLGGSVDPGLGTITTTIKRLSGFAVFEGLFAAASTGAGRGIDIQPRAFSPKGNTFDTRAAISFDLTSGGSVRVFVHDRSGRIVRRVFDGSLGPGRNVLYWDGRDGGGDVVPSGLYLVTIKAEGNTDVKSVAVVNR
jgi:ligand-binding sensor domain-containing protein